MHDFHMPQKLYSAKLCFSTNPAHHFTVECVYPVVPIWGWGGGDGFHEAAHRALLVTLMYMQLQQEMHDSVF